MLHVLYAPMMVAIYQCGLPPELFRVDQFSPTTISDAVNVYVMLGEERSNKLMNSLSSGFAKDFVRGFGAENSHRTNFSLNERIGWVCRILYVSKNEGPLRPPRFGALSLPVQSMPLLKWPMYPVVSFGGTHFVLSQGYRVAGTPEALGGYLAYCRKNGTFRKHRVPVPSRQQAMTDLAGLVKSMEWKSINWGDRKSGRGGFYSEELIIEFLKAQVEGIQVD